MKPLFLFIFYFSSLLSFEKDLSESKKPYCPFCDPNVLEAQAFYEDELVYALYTHRPIFPGHCLVIPKRHLERFEEVSDLEALQMMQVIKKVNFAVMRVFDTSAYLLLQKNGKEVGQSVPHIHFHYIPRKAGDDSTFKFLYRMYAANIGKPISSNEMEHVVSLMRKAILEGSDTH